MAHMFISCLINLHEIKFLKMRQNKLVKFTTTTYFTPMQPLFKWANQLAGTVIALA